MNKKLLLGLILAGVAIILVSFFIFSQNNNSIYSKADYTKVAEDFIEAVKSEENMDEFLNKYLNEKALYAYISDDMFEVEEMDDYVKLFSKKINNADENDVKEKIEGYIAGFKGFASYGLKIELKDTTVNKSEEYPEFQSLEAKYIDDEGEEISFFFELYKGKLYMISSDGSLDYTYYEKDEEDDNESSLTRAEKRKINNRIDQKMISGNRLEGSEVIALIDEIIKINEENIDNEIFIEIHLNLDDSNSTYDLMSACNNVYFDSSKENVKKAIEEMKKVKSLINSKEDYYCMESLNKGLVSDVSIEKYDGQDNF